MATYTWLPASGGDFATASNWTLDGINPASTTPGQTDNTVFAVTATGTISGDGNVARIDFVNSASDWTLTGQIATGAIDISGMVALASGASIVASIGAGIAATKNSSGTFVVGPGATYSDTAAAQTVNYLFNIGNGSGANGTVIVQGAGAVVDTGSNPASIALNPGSTGALEIAGGGVATFATTNPSALVSLSLAKGGTGTVTVDGSGSQLQLSGAMYAGRGGTGTVTLTNGASLTETAVGTGFSSAFGSGGNVNGVFSTAGTGTLNVLSGSTATFGDSLSFGSNGTIGIGLVSDGTLNVGGLLRLGSGTAAPGGKGTLTIDDGGTVRDTAAADPSTAYVLVGATAGTTGTAVIDGHGSTLDAGANGIDIGVIGTGTMTVSDHGLVKSSDLVVGDSGNGTLNLTGGGDALAGAYSTGTGAVLAVGAHAGGTGAISVSGYGSVLAGFGEAVVGGTDTGTGVTAGGTGTVSVSQGGLLATGSMTIEAGSSVQVDRSSAALIAGDLSDGGDIASSGLLVATGTMSGGGSLALDGGLADLGTLDASNVSFGGASATLRVHALSGTSTVSGMQTGDVIDLTGQTGVTLSGDTVTTSSGMLFLSPAPAGDTYKLVSSQHGTEVLLTATSPHGSGHAATADASQSAGSADFSADMLQDLGFIQGTSGSDDAAGHAGANAHSGVSGAGDSTGLSFAGVDLSAAHQHYAS